METFAQDFRYALRSLAGRPGFAVVVVLTLALGFGATAALFSVAEAVLLRRLPFTEPGELVQVWERHETQPHETNVVSPANFADWRREAGSFDGLAGYWRRSASLTGLGEPEEVQLAIASPEIFRLLGVAPAAGRLFAAADVPAGELTGDVAVLSHDYWQRRFGGAPEAVGRTVTVGTSSVVIVGVAPPSARLVEPATDLWMPTAFDWADRASEGRFISSIARLAPGVSLERAQAEMDAVARRLAAAHPDFNTGWGVALVPLSEELVGDVRPALLLLLGAVGLLLLIACANVAHLMLARATGREREIAIRSALGAGSVRIFRQLLTESALLVAVAAVAGLALAAYGGAALLALLPADLRIPQLDDVRVDGAVVGFMGLLALLAGLVFGLVPVLGTWTPRLVEGLREGRGENPARRRGLRSGLVVGEIALALVLAAGAGLLFRSFLELRRVDPGLRVEGVLTARVSLPFGRYGEPEARAAFFREARERVMTQPGVESASAIQWLPLSGRRSATYFYVEDRPRPEVGAEPVTDVRVVLLDYFKTVGMPLVAGRALDERDHAEAPAVAVVNETLARRYWPDENPIGRRLAYDWGDWVSVEVVGVVGDVRHNGIEQDVAPAIFRPHAQDPNGEMNLVIRTAVEPSTLAAAVTGAVHEIDPLLPVANFRTLEGYYSAALAGPRLHVWLFGAFSLLALALAAVGVYGVISFTVAQRTREIGIRMALGAGRASVAALVVRHGVGLALAGAVLGLASALALARLMKSLLYGVGTSDPWTFAVVPLVLVTVAAVASLVPARRASRVDPTVTLRYE